MRFCFSKATVIYHTDQCGWARDLGHFDRPVMPVSTYLISDYELLRNRRRQGSRYELHVLAFVGRAPKGRTWTMLIEGALPATRYRHVLDIAGGELREIDELTVCVRRVNFPSFVPR